MNSGLKRRDVVVVCTASGKPDVFFGSVLASDEDVANWKHTDLARKECIEAGFEPVICFDENDPGFKYFQKGKVAIKVVDGVCLYEKDERADVLFIDKDVMDDVYSVPAEFEKLGDEVGLVKCDFDFHENIKKTLKPHWDLNLDGSYLRGKDVIELLEESGMKAVNNAFELANVTTDNGVFKLVAVKSQNPYFVWIEDSENIDFTHQFEFLWEDFAWAYNHLGASWLEHKN